MIWAVVIDNIECRFFHFSRNPLSLSLILTIDHPENRLKNQDLSTDRPGHFATSTTYPNNYTQPKDPKEIKLEEFAREINEKLNHSRSQQAYHSLIIISPPKMKGILFNSMNKNVENLITHTFTKDLYLLKENELLNFIDKNTQFPQK